ncbi:MAG: methyl-accepting chemotaxis protein [Lachnospiraceae bacterium]|nr:methyl-accepting chemotaxis protein [Lachnospiraceae bacterium]MEE1342750.1 methyl-accepting chemotaxis protein [Lachnospiraceae bacterium]
MKNKKTSIKWWIFAPIAIMAAMMFISNGTSIVSLKNVNKEAKEISDVYLEGISRLGDIQGDIKDLHSMALSHIVATDVDSMINLVNSINEEISLIDKELEEYKAYAKNDTKLYNEILNYYEETKKEIAKMVALSADTQNEKAFAIANNELKTNTEAMYANIEEMVKHSKSASTKAKNSLQVVYGTSIGTTIFVTIVSIVLVVLAFLSIQLKVLRPISKTNKALLDIMQDIDQRQGDLTKRIPVYQNDEVGALTSGINAFIERLQSILKTVTNSSNQMNSIAGEVTNSMVKSNTSVTDLSAVTEELSATMAEVGNNATLINENANSVSGEVKDIATRTNEISGYTKKMKDHADSMETTAKVNMETTSQKVTEILEVLNKAIKESESVQQVNTLSEDILGIAKQTNLLSLNASIEAARAGEAGKGFAVVATQISQLASESQEAANHIQEINNVVTAAVTNLVEQSTGLVNYMKDSILTDFDSFVLAGGEYRKNASYIEGVMEEFAGKTEVLNNSVSEIAKSIDSISVAIGEGVNGVSSTAESMQTLAMEIDEVSRKMEENQAISESLKKETEIFVNL